MVDVLEPEVQPKKRGRPARSTALGDNVARQTIVTYMDSLYRDAVFTVGEAVCLAMPKERIDSLIYKALAFKTALEAVNAIPES